MVQRTSEKISEMDLLSEQTSTVLVPVTMGADSYRLPIASPGTVAALSRADTGVTNAAVLDAAILAANLVYVATGKQQTVVIPPGGAYKVAISATSSWALPLVGTTAEFHKGVTLRSGVRIYGPGVTLVPVPPADASASWYYAVFGTTALNASTNALVDVSIEGINFEFNPTVWTVATTAVYGVMAVGVTRLRLDGLSCQSSGVRNGRLARVMNADRVTVLDLRCHNITQALYLNYITDLRVTGSVDTFVEAFDIDSPCTDVYFDVVCRNGQGEGQCLDITSVKNGYFKLVCSNVGNAAIIYQKPDSYPTFALWCSDLVTDTPAAAPVFCDNVTLEVSGTNIHGADTRSIQVNLNREDPPTPNYWDGKGIIKRITVRALLSDCDPILVYECDGLDLTADMEDVTCGTSNRLNNAAVLLRQSRSSATPVAESKLSGRAVVRVKNSDRTGVCVIGPTDFHLEATVDGYNSANDATASVASGVRIEGLLLKDGALTIANIRCDNGDTTVAPVDLRFSADGAGVGTIRIHDLGGHRLASGSAQPASGGSTSISTVGASGEAEFVFDTTGASHTVYLVPIRSQGAVLINAVCINEAAITGDPVNFTQLSMRRVRAGVLSSAIGTAISYDAANVAAGVVTALGVTGGDSDGVFLDGDFLVIQATKNGTGSAQTNLWVRWSLVEYAL